MRKLLYIVFIICANIGIITHELTPHLHHDGFICMTNSEHGNCGSCHHAEEISTCENTGSEIPQHANTESCELLKYVEPNNEHSKLFVQNNNLFTTLFPVFCVLVSPIGDLFAVTEVKYKIYLSYFLTYKSPLVGKIFDLRAPPFFI